MPGGIHRPGAAVRGGASGREATAAVRGETRLLAHTGHKGAWFVRPANAWGSLERLRRGG